MSADERRALALIAALLLIAAGARWLERPRALLPDVPDVDLTALEAASRDARPARGDRPRATSRSTRSRGNPAVAGNATADALIDPNTATAEELATLPGVGPALAARMIAERERAPFASASDLQRVRGIGATLAQSLARHVTLAPGSAPPHRPAGPASTPLEKGVAAGASGDVPRPIDINEVSTTDLQRVPGVGPVLAARLIARRDSLGRFSDWQQIDAVTGVGPALLDRLQKRVILGQ